MKEIALLPDVNMGSKLYSTCETSQTNSWGRVVAANYHFTLEKINGSPTGFGFAQVSVDTVTTKY
jgi:hypothetical protein